ncbi:MAG TPA: ABC transporter ATP-binding protein, partial [Acidimicrobiales bacterium]
HPQVFLMDEPLSNLDAKLRVEMRAEIARLQRELAVTTVYVTHDQTEAMTMGTRVAVLRDGRLQQVDTPQRLYDDPVNLFVATFIGSPSMNVFGATIEQGPGDGLALRLGDQRLALDGDVVAAHPRLRALVGRPVVAGIRPEAFDLAGERGAPADAAVEATVDLVESLGAELIVHLSVAGPPADAATAQGDAWAQVVGRRGRAVARLGPRVRPAPGDVVELVVDMSGLHLFDPETGASLRGAAQDAPARDRDAAGLATTDA